MSSSTSGPVGRLDFLNRPPTSLIFVFQRLTNISTVGISRLTSLLRRKIGRDPTLNWAGKDPELLSATGEIENNKPQLAKMETKKTQILQLVLRSSYILPWC